MRHMLCVEEDGGLAGHNGNGSRYLSREQSGNGSRRLSREQMGDGGRSMRRVQEGLPLEETETFFGVTTPPGQADMAATDPLDDVVIALTEGELPTEAGVGQEAGTEDEDLI